MNKLRLAISTCPNDTYAFHAILNRKIDYEGLQFEFELLDIQQLNDGLFDGQFDVAKASMHAALYLTESTVILPVGAALGFGVGPLLLSKRPYQLDSAGRVIAPPKGDSSVPESDDGHDLNRTKRLIALCPGKYTTATFLFQSLISADAELRQVVFSKIMPALKDGNADLGVCIHEGRFTWKDQGLYCVADLGTLWESATNVPLPLGGILAKKELGPDIHRQVTSVIRRSIEYANQHRQETLPTMRKYAQELSDSVLMAHVDLYVNEWTIDLGEQGRQALDALLIRAKEIGLVGESTLLDVVSA